MEEYTKLNGIVVTTGYHSQTLLVVSIIRVRFAADLQYVTAISLLLLLLQTAATVNSFALCFIFGRFQSLVGYTRLKSKCRKFVCVSDICVSVGWLFHWTLCEQHHTQNTGRTEKKRIISSNYIFSSRK